MLDPAKLIGKKLKPAKIPLAIVAGISFLLVHAGLTESIFVFFVTMWSAILAIIAFVYNQEETEEIGRLQKFYFAAFFSLFICLLSLATISFNVGIIFPSLYTCPITSSTP